MLAGGWQSQAARVDACAQRTAALSIGHTCKWMLYRAKGVQQNSQQRRVLQHVSGVVHPISVKDVQTQAQEVNEQHALAGCVRQAMYKHHLYLGIGLCFQCPK